MYRTAIRVLAFTGVLVLGAVAAWGITGGNATHVNLHDGIETSAYDGGVGMPDSGTRRPR